MPFSRIPEQNKDEIKSEKERENERKKNERYKKYIIKG
jgi:hypothetical protein